MLAMMKPRDMQSNEDEHDVGECFMNILERLGSPVDVSRHREAGRAKRGKERQQDDDHGAASRVVAPR